MIAQIGKNWQKKVRIAWIGQHTLLVREDIQINLLLWQEAQIWHPYETGACSTWDRAGTKFRLASLPTSDSFGSQVQSFKSKYWPQSLFRNKEWTTNAYLLSAGGGPDLVDVLLLLSAGKQSIMLYQNVNGFVYVLKKIIRIVKYILLGI